MAISLIKINKNIKISFNMENFNSLTDLQKRYLAYLILSNKINTSILLNDDIVINTNIKNSNKLHGLLFYISMIKLNDIEIKDFNTYYCIKISDKLIDFINEYININDLNMNNLDIYDR